MVGVLGDRAHALIDADTGAVVSAKSVHPFSTRFAASDEGCLDSDGSLLERGQQGPSELVAFDVVVSGAIGPHGAEKLQVFPDGTMWARIIRATRDKMPMQMSY